MRATWQFNYWFGIAACCGIAGICCLWSPAGAPLVRNGDVSTSLRPLHVLRQHDPALTVPDWQPQPALGETQRSRLGSPAGFPQSSAGENSRPGATERTTEAPRQEEFARQVAVTDPLVGVVRLADLEPAGLDLEAEFAALRAPASSPAPSAQPAEITPQAIAPEFAPLPEIRAQPRRQPQTAKVPAQPLIRLTGIEPISD